MELCRPLILGVLLLTSLSTGSASAAPRYRVIDLGTLGGDDSTAWGINAKGQVVGDSKTINRESHAFLYSDGKITDLGTLPGHNYSCAHAINDGAQVVGDSARLGDDDKFPYNHAFLYSNGKMTELGTLGGPGSEALSINASGQVVGMSDTADGKPHAFLYSKGKMTDLGTLGGKTSLAWSINASGQVSGHAKTSDDNAHIFVYSDGKMSDLGMHGSAQGINAIGQLAGYSSRNRKKYAILYSEGRATDLGILPGFFESYAKGINNKGIVVGVLFNRKGSPEHGFLYCDGKMIDLNSLIDRDSGWTVVTANAINDAGQIVGEGRNEFRETHAILLTPVAQSSASSLMEASAGRSPDGAPSQPPNAPAVISKGADAINRAIQSMRGIQPSKLTEAEKNAKMMELNRAWITLAKGGPEAAKGLHQALAEDRKSARKDDFFALGAAALLWQINGAAERNEIAGIWQNADQTVNYNYVFGTAVEAARTHDPRVLPMLRALLHEKRSEFFVTGHSMNLTWPMCQEFVWEIFGSGGLAALEDVLATSKNLAELETAMLLLTRDQDLKSLANIRRLATHEDSAVRSMAIQCLGLFGHPDDFVMLTSGLNSTKAGERVAYLTALSLYGDLRAAPLAVRYFDVVDTTVRQAVLNALVSLPSPESLAAIQQRAELATDPEEKKACGQCAEQLLKLVGIPWEVYRTKSAVQKKALFEADCKKEQQRYVLSPADRRLSRPEFLKAAAEWQERHRITGGKYDWVEDRHVMAVATAADLPLLIDVRACVCERISDECLDDIQTLNRVIQRIGRSRYREEVGLNEKVEAAKTSRSK